MTTGLSISRLISVSVNLAPTAAQAPNLNSLLIVGDSDIIDTQTRILSFNSLTDVATLFGTTAPEYLAASLFFAQSPSPTQLYIGRWAKIATNGRLFGGALSAAQQLLSVFTAVTSGGFKITVDGGSQVNVSGINLSAVSNLNGVATAINTALASATVGATVAWDGTRFTFKSATTGATSAVAVLAPPTSGTDLGLLLNGTLALGARSVGGIAAETPLAAVVILDGLPTGWYALTFAASHSAGADALADSDTLAVAAYIEGVTPKHLFGVSTQAAGSTDPTSTTDIGYLLKTSNYQQTAWQYNSAGLYAVASLFGRILTTNFAANNSTITLMYKQEPGITAENLNATQADAIKNKNGNVFVNYDNATAIIQFGTVANGYFIDEVYYVAALRFAVQTDLYNALYTSTTKIPQTDAGMGQLATVIEGTLSRYVTNGLIGPGTWTNGGFGQLVTGQFLPSGFYVYTPPLANQSTADRAARKSVSFQVAAKLAGAVHSVDVILSVNR